jgi:hypothetical protein
MSFSCNIFYSVPCILACAAGHYCASVDRDQEMRQLLDTLLATKEFEATLLLSSALIDLIRRRADEIQSLAGQSPPQPT